MRRRATRSRRRSAPTSATLPARTPKHCSWAHPPVRLAARPGYIYSDHDGLSKIISMIKRALHRAEPAMVVAVDAVGVDAEQDFDGVSGPLSDQWSGSSRVEPPGDARVPEVVGLVRQERRLLGL